MWLLVMPVRGLFRSSSGSCWEGWPPGIESVDSESHKADGPLDTDVWNFGVWIYGVDGRYTEHVRVDGGERAVVAIEVALTYSSSSSSEGRGWEGIGGGSSIERYR